MNKKSPKTNHPKVDLSKLRVEILDDIDDFELAGDMLSRGHYLGNKKLAGERLSYVAIYRGQWLAIAHFDKATERSRVREDRIGWSARVRKERIKYITNNSRFLILPNYSGVKNLASKVLSLIAARISSDWEKRWGHPLFLLETYVDPEQGNTGSCYKAAGWERIGISAGYKKADGNRTNPKDYFLKALHKHSYESLAGEFETPQLSGLKPLKGSNNNFVIDPNKIDFKSLKEHLSLIKDPRGRQGRRYELLPILTLSCAAVLSGYTQYQQISDWISNLAPEIRAKAGIRSDRKPSPSMLQKLLSRINSKELEDVLSKWVLSESGTLFGSTISLDGKHHRATSSSLKGQKKFLNVLVQDIGIVVKEYPTKMGHGEGAAAREALKELPLEGTIVTADALHTERATARAVVKKTAGFCSLSKTITKL